MFVLNAGCYSMMLLNEGGQDSMPSIDPQHAGRSKFPHSQYRGINKRIDNTWENIIDVDR